MGLSAAATVLRRVRRTAPSRDAGVSEERAATTGWSAKKGDSANLAKVVGRKGRGCTATALVDALAACEEVVDTAVVEAVADAVVAGGPGPDVRLSGLVTIAAGRGPKAAGGELKGGKSISQSWTPQLAPMKERKASVSAGGFSDVDAALEAAGGADLPAPRIRLRRSWVASTFLAAGPPVLREALAKRSDLIHDLASVFDVGSGSLDPALATNVAQVLKALLVEYPRETATALVQFRALVPGCVANIHVQPAADLIPRLVGTRVFSTDDSVAIVPMHKRAIAMLARVNVQDMLAKRFVCAADSLAVAGGRYEMGELGAILAGAAATMGDVSSRAMCLPLKAEDPDERHDGAYVSNLSIVPAYVYNDAKASLDLVVTPAPLVAVLDKALGLHASDVVLLPALQLVTTILRALYDARASDLPSVRSTVAQIDTSKLCSELVLRAPEFASLLGSKANAPIGAPLGRHRLALIDLIHRLCATADDNTLCKLLLSGGDDVNLFNSILDLLDGNPLNDLLWSRAAQLLRFVVNHQASESLLNALMQSSRVFSFLGSHLSSGTQMMHLAPVIRAARDALRRNSDGLIDNDASAALASTQQFIEACASAEKAVEDKEKHLCWDTRMGTTKSKEFAGDLRVEKMLSASEDYCQELYMHTLLEQVSQPGSTIDPDVNVSRTVQAVEAVEVGKTKSISWRRRAQATLTS